MGKKGEGEGELWCDKKDCVRFFLLYVLGYGFGLWEVKGNGKFWAK